MTDKTCVDYESMVLLTAKDVGEIFHMGKNQVYNLMRSSGFPTIRINNRMYVQKDALQKWLNRYQGRIYFC